jgi:hypothetical protein
MDDHERQFNQAIEGVFGTELGKWLLKELQANTARPFVADNQYRTAYRCGQQELVQMLIDITEGK